MRYENNGRYNKHLIEEAKQDYVSKTGNSYPESDKDQKFIDFIHQEATSVATGKSVIVFLKEALKLKARNGNIWTPFQIECLLNTYTNIMKAIKWKD